MDGSNHFGIEPIGLGEPAYGTSEGPDLARIDDCEPQPSASERRCDSDLETAGHLEHDQGGRRLVQMGDRPLQAGMVTGDGESRSPPA